MPVTVTCVTTTRGSGGVYINAHAAFPTHKNTWKIWYSGKDVRHTVSAAVNYPSYKNSLLDTSLWTMGPAPAPSHTPLEASFNGSCFFLGGGDL